MRAVIYRGKMHSDKNALLRFQTIDDDPEKLPKDFGGLSGSGLWRIHFVDRGAGKFDIIEKRLWGITSWQIDKQNSESPCEPTFVAHPIRGGAVPLRPETEAVSEPQLP